MNLPYRKPPVRLIADSAKGRGFSFILCCVYTLMAALLSFLAPQVVRFAIDSVIYDEPAEWYWTWALERFTGPEATFQLLMLCAGIGVGIGLLQFFFNYQRRYRGMEISEHMAQSLRNALYSHIQRLPYEWHVKCQTGDIIQRSTSDVDTIRNFFQNQFTELVRTVLVFLIAVVLMLSMDPFMTLMSMILIPAVLGFSYLYFKKIGKEFAKADEEEGRLQSCMQENFTGVRVVRAFGRERFEVDRFKAINQKYADKWAEIGKQLGNFWGIGDTLAALQLALVIGIDRKSTRLNSSH